MRFRPNEHGGGRCHLAALAGCLMLNGCTQWASEPSDREGAATARVASDPMPRSGALSDADFGGHVTVLRGRLDARGLGDLAIRIQPPFVVIGDDSADALAGHVETVRWAVDRLERDFFERGPDRILDVYLFGDAESYEAGVKSLTNESPTTPFGFYSGPDDALFMNIATGGGTLIHEMVHPYVEADFPGAPPWLNEGLGSLFEQSAERDGHIVGLTNWRLADLQQAIREGSVPTLSALTQLTDEQFYSDDRAIHYAQARYLLYYLQESDLLIPFYRAFRSGRASDPTGHATLVATLGERDMAAFDLRWQAWVATLRFP